MNELLRELQDIIAQDGPISLERYMGLALSHPRYGYYTTREPFGVAGDFVTAPEISQMFGELIGLWAVEVWRLAGTPAPTRLVELGPGRGTLMADALRAIRKVPEFWDAITVHLVESSPRLAELQRTMLRDFAVPISWPAGAEYIPSGPAIFIANEFFDALPVRHFVRTDTGWCERLVGLDAAGKLTFGLGANANDEIGVVAPNGSILEVGLKARERTQALAKRITMTGGALLIIDYGYTETRPGETLQAVRHHHFADPLEAPGHSDLTAHVDFAALAREAEAAGARVHGPVTQAEFLLRLGLAERAQMLKRKASSGQAEAIDGAFVRLTDRSQPTSMGELFKAMAITPQGMQFVPGFAD